MPVTRSSQRSAEEASRRHGWGGLAASRYVQMMQARRSLLIWKVFGQRLDGFTNDDLPYEATPGDPATLRYRGKAVAATPQLKAISHVGYTGSAMPPPATVPAEKALPEIMTVREAGSLPCDVTRSATVPLVFVTVTV